MLINETYEENQNDKRVEFVSYNGAYPTLCYGVLTLLIDGEEYRFNDHDEYYQPVKGTYPKFWTSGGECYFTDSSYTNACVTDGEWQINVDKLPDHLKELASEIDEVFNWNVKYGCCGGCL